MKQPETGSSTSQQLTRRLLGLSDKIYRSLEPGIPHERLSMWLSSDLTVAQLRVLLLLHIEGPMRMSAVATHLGIAVSTATGFVDKLVAKDMLVREDDPEDRRLVICKLTEKGSKLSSALWDFGRAQIERLLNGLTEEQLRQAVHVVEFLYAHLASNNRAGAEG
jgi:Transcriptional regulators